MKQAESLFYAASESLIRDEHRARMKRKHTYKRLWRRKSREHFKRVLIWQRQIWHKHAALRQKVE